MLSWHWNFPPIFLVRWEFVELIKKSILFWYFKDALLSGKASQNTQIPTTASQEMWWQECEIERNYCSDIRLNEVQSELRIV